MFGLEDKIPFAFNKQGQGFSWGQVIGYGLKLLLAIAGGNGNAPDGIDKMGVSDDSHPMQVCKSFYMHRGRICTLLNYIVCQVYLVNRGIDST